MDEKATPKMENSELSELSVKINDFRDSFYKKHTLNNNEYNEELAREFLYGDKGLKSLDGDYLVSKYVVATQIASSIDFINKDAENDVLFTTCMFGYKKDDGKFINETDKELLNIVLTRTILTEKQVKRTINDAIKKTDNLELPKRAKAGWLQKVDLLTKNNSLSKLDRKKLQLCMYIINKEIENDKISIPKISNILNAIFDVQNQNEAKNKMNISTKKKEMEMIKNDNDKNNVDESPTKENINNVKEFLGIDKKEEEKTLRKKDTSNVKMVDLSPILTIGSKKSGKEIEDKIKYVCNELNNHFRNTYEDNKKKIIYTSVRNVVDFTMNKTGKALNSIMSNKALKMSNKIIEDLKVKSGGKYGEI